MGFQVSCVRYRKKVAQAVSVKPRYGMSTATVINKALIDSLTNYGPTAGVIDTTFTLNAPVGSGLYQYFAYPASYGHAQFLDLDSNFYGGWDGANDDPMNVFGPVLFDYDIGGGNMVPYYVYRTDYPDLTLSRWTASLDPSA